MSREILNYEYIKSEMFEKRVDRAIVREEKKGWRIEEGDKSQKYAIVSPEGSVFMVDGVRLDYGSEIEYEFMDSDRQHEIDQVERLHALMQCSSNYLGFDKRLVIPRKSPKSI